MYAKVAVLALLPLAAVNAAPAPAPGLLDDVKSLFNGVTSNVGERIESATSVVGSVVGSVRASETASSIFAQVTSVLGTETQSAFATIVTANGVPVVEVTQVSGSAITIATQSGSTTTFAGHTFTVAPPAPSSSSSSSSSSGSSSSSSASASATNSKSSASSLNISKGTLVGAATFVGSVLAGAFML